VLQFPLLELLSFLWQRQLSKRIKEDFSSKDFVYHRKKKFQDFVEFITSVLRATSGAG